MTEFNLSNKIEPRMFDNGNDVDVLFPKDVKEFIKRRDKQVDDMYLDILALIETHKGTKQELIVKMNRLCLEHRIELNKLAGSMPTPKNNETKEEFIKRFMSSAEANRDYPDRSQRFAVANSMWENHISKKIKAK